ncbi:MAG: AtpZ/AtpI family protein [Clostridia bacterium]|nr:AtpZ/AtpI family protein [Clostridia bacterium]
MSRFKDKKQKQNEMKDVAKGLSLISYLGVMMLVTVVTGVFIGVLLDKIVGTKFIFTLIFSFFGILAAFRNMYYQVMKK